MRHTVSAVAKVVIFACFLGVQSATFGQTVSVTDPPPKIEFEPWRETRTSEFYSRYEFTFPSAVTSKYAENNSIKVKVYLPSERIGPVPTVILLHYWGATDDNVEVSMAEKLASRGIASVIFPLPYHMSRTPAGTRSGEMAILPDPEHLKLTMLQSVSDVRRAVDWIQTRPELKPDTIGITGTSLGAIVTALAFAVEPRIKASAYILGGVDLAHILWNSSRVVSQREALRREGYTEEKLRTVLSDIEPLNYLKPDGRKSYVVRAKFDTVLPGASSERLISALDNPDVLEIETGHYGGALIQGRLVTTVVRFFEATFHGTEFTAPSRFYSPTIRLGLTFNPDRGLQVAGGLDVWRLNKSSDAFASVLLTPRGIEGFVGYSFSKGISLGVSITPRRTTIGGFWSVVF